MDNKEISVVICTLNSEDTIEEVLKSVQENKPLEIILVDASSTDQTREIAQKYVTKIVTDPRQGLAVARNIGLKEVQGKYLFFCGSDNVIEKNTLTRLKTYLLEHKWIGASCLTRVRWPNRNYFSRGLDLRWQMRFFEGPREVIGTPYLIQVEILRRFRYDPKMAWSDDSDLAVKLKEAGFEVGYSNIVCYEVGFDDVKSILGRFRSYGRSDYEYYNKYSSGWNLLRKIKSLLHPLEAEFIQPIARINSLKYLYYLPFFIIITLYRYRGYIKYLIKGLKIIIAGT